VAVGAEPLDQAAADEAGAAGDERCAQNILPFAAAMIAMLSPPLRTSSRSQRR